MRFNEIYCPKDHMIEPYAGARLDVRAVVEFKLIREETAIEDIIKTAYWCRQCKDYYWERELIQKCKLY